MKKIISLCAVSLLFAGCAGVMGGGNPQIQQLESHSSTIAADFVVALTYSAEAYSDAFVAVGNKEEAERIKSEAGNLKNDAEQDKLEASVGTLNEVDIGPALENAAELSAEGKKLIASALLNLGIAILYDGKIVVEVPGVVSDAKNILQNLSPTDVTSAGSVKNIISNASFIADVAPDQLALLKKNFETLKAYANAHGISVPSQEDIEREASNLTRE